MKVTHTIAALIFIKTGPKSPVTDESPVNRTDLHLFWKTTLKKCFGRSPQFKKKLFLLTIARPPNDQNNQSVTETIQVSKLIKIKYYPNFSMMFAWKTKTFIKIIKFIKIINCINGSS